MCEVDKAYFPSREMVKKALSMTKVDFIAWFASLPVKERTALRDAMKREAERHRAEYERIMNLLGY